MPRCPAAASRLRGRPIQQGLDGVTVLGDRVRMPLSSREDLTKASTRKEQLLRLGLQGGGLGPAAPAVSSLLRQQGGVQQQIGDGGLGLVGHVGDQSRDLALFLRQIPGGGRRSR